ncbi:MAG: hypothetical protein GFH27_549325n9 [Chloroflexi bacterium AL-W]|nr:hypothetical protein [Chloroflexi bacterium AL-N1]NOK70141.1 hypothetical protein [Chloroflexi bacterium AL-N10]NOK77847.1 hypothetical protein [Chloroflexi bacterium AL-N5]NOK84856.1 hypothetical protein [Chloroflexi bacterium AL-W]NOK91835.1 hypothetical protein [Chloroflexi bacterium AL-N15]
MTRLRLVFDQRDGQTVLREQYASSPLKIVRPFALEHGRVLLQLVNVGPGVMANDAFDIHITLCEGAKVVLLNQSATKLHSMPTEARATQHVQIHLAAEAELEYYPGLSIPYRGTAFQQQITVELAMDAKFAFFERWAMGRIAFGERFVFRHLASQIKVYRDNLLLYADALELSKDAPQIGLTDHFAYLGAGFWFWNVLPEPPLIVPISNMRLADPALVCDAFRMDAAYVRVLANDGLTLRQHIHTFINDWHERIGLERLDFGRFGS